MVEIVFQKVVFRKIGDVRGLNMGDISRGEDSDVHGQLIPKDRLPARYHREREVGNRNSYG